MFDFIRYVKVLLYMLVVLVVYLHRQPYAKTGSGEKMRRTHRDTRKPFGLVAHAGPDEIEAAGVE